MKIILECAIGIGDKINHSEHGKGSIEELKFDAFGVTRDPADSSIPVHPMMLVRFDAGYLLWLPPHDLAYYKLD